MNHADAQYSLRLQPAQYAALMPHIKGKEWYDLGAGDLAQSRALLTMGAKKVVAIEPKPREKIRSKKISVVKAYFTDVSIPIDHAFISWPLQGHVPGLARLVYKAKMVVYIGKNSDCTVCGPHGLWAHFIKREILVYAPSTRNTLIVYGDKLPEPRKMRGEEYGGLLNWTELWKTYEELEAKEEWEIGDEERKYIEEAKKYHPYGPPESGGFSTIIF